MNILAPKYESFSDELRKQNGDFLENGYKDFDYISALYGDCIPKEMSIRGLFTKITVLALGAQTWKGNFV
jgi:hypothetical protein